MTITIDINKEKLFSGLDNSIWLNKHSLGWKIDYLIDTEEISPTDDIKWTVDKKEYLKEIATTYCNGLSRFIDNSQWDIETIKPNNHIILKWINPPKDAKKTIQEFLTNNDHTFFEESFIYDRYGADILDDIATWTKNGQPLY